MEDIALVNKVSQSGLVTINLEDYFPMRSFEVFDIKDYLFHGLILKEKDFRESLKQLDWTKYQSKTVLVQCTTDAIIPMWAYMLISSNLEGMAYDVYLGSQEEYLKLHYKRVFDDLDITQYIGGKIVIKGCGTKPVPAMAYAQITKILKPHVQSIMFGEPCSTVPIFKKPLNR